MQRFYDFFDFTRAERRGILVLSILSFIILIFPSVYKFIKDDSELSHTLIDLQSDEPALFIEKQRAYSNTIAQKKSIQTKARHNIFYFSFNPNKLSRENWKNLGLSDKQIDVIYNYEAKGGEFRVKADLRKMYVIDEEMYIALEPYIDIPEQLSYKNKSFLPINRVENNKASITKFDINSADTAQLMQVRGIGTVLSSRIIKFRNALGGLYNSEQLKDVYGLSVEAQAELLKYIVVDINNLQLISINDVTKVELQKHPYVDNKQAQLIINYRDQHGKYSQLRDLEKLHGLDPDFLRKIGPYLKF